ncbi:MAG: hypothetical protein AB1673_08510 [Actinomycetota bacterium]
MKKTTLRRLGAIVGTLAVAAGVAACGDDGPGTHTVTAADYRFENLPATVESGATLELVNSSSVELHELVAVRLPDSEQRSVDDLIRLPEAEIEALFTGPPAMVLLRAPGGDQIAAVGDGKLTERGRYLILCAIPIGADPDAYIQAAQASGDGPPDVPGGAPHFTQGMYGQIIVQ